MAAPAPAAGLRYEFDTTPEPGGTLEVADGVHWLRMPLPFALAHINLWLLEDGDGWVIVDAGLHVEDSTDIWERTLAGVMQGRGVDRVVVTHMHPDHAGNAGWLCEKLGAELYMTRQEYLYCRVLTADTGKPPPAAGLEFYRAAGRIWSPDRRTPSSGQNRQACSGEWPLPTMTCHSRPPIARLSPSDMRA